MTRFARLIALACLVAATAHAQSVVVADGTREVRVELASLPPIHADVRDPTDGSLRRLDGRSLAAALAKLPAPAGADAIAVRADDGWLSLVPLDAALHRSSALLATDDNGAPLPPPRGPVFLAWPDVEAAPPMPGDAWVFQVARLEYVRAADLRLAVPSSASLAQRRGATVFEQNCLHCHAWNGRGGMAAWDLAQPPLATYRTPAAVRAYVRDPRAKNPLGHMPAFGKKLSPSEMTALLALLFARS